MAKFNKKGVRCDWCGKFANNQLGEYLKADQSFGYMWPAQNEGIGDDPAKDICEECMEKHFTSAAVIESPRTCTD